MGGFERRSRRYVFGRSAFLVERTAKHEQVPCRSFHFVIPEFAETKPLLRALLNTQ
jgi:hypothetical protein